MYIHINLVWALGSPFTIYIYRNAHSLSFGVLWYLVYIDPRDLISNMPSPGDSFRQGVTWKSPPLHGE